ncbi:helix-turn-helix domain-containing protein [Roseateles sp. P5_E11]
MDLAITFGHVLRKLRKQAGLTQEKLGFEADLERNFVSLLERGKRQPTLTTMVRLARPLNTTASHLVALVEATLEALEASGAKP